MNNSRTNGIISRIWLIPLVIVIVVVPLVLSVHLFYNGMEGFSWFGEERESLDLALYYKALLIKTCGAIAMVLIIGLYVKNKPSFIDDKKSYGPILSVLLFSILSILSSALASHSWEASFGGYARFEGCYVVLSYVVFFYFTFGYARSIELIKFLLDALMVGAALLSLLGVVEVFSGMRLIEMEWFKPFLYLVEPVDIKITSSLNMISSTLENSNYVGSYVPLVLPYCLLLLIRGEKLWRRIMAGITFELMGIYLYASGSETGLIAVAAGLFVLLFFFVFGNEQNNQMAGRRSRRCSCYSDSFHSIFKRNHR